MATPVVFVHGLWMHASSWGAWADKFRAAGYDPVAVDWPGDPATIEEARANPERLAGKSVQEIADHVARIIDGLPEKPLLVGHSFGGLMVQKLLDSGHGRAAVAIDSAQIKGVLPLPPNVLKATSPVLLNPRNVGRAVSFTKEQFRYAFGNAIPAAESDALWEKWQIPAPGRPLFQVAFANVNPKAQNKVDVTNSTRGPLLLIAGGKDNLVPAAITRANHKRYARSTAITEIEEFADRGHSLTLDAGWEEIADATLAFFRRHGF